MKAIRLLAAAFVVTACSGEDTKVRDRMIEIAQWEDRGSIGPERELATLLYHKDLKVREEVVWALGRIGDMTTIQDLSEATTLDTMPLYPATAWAMGQLATLYSSDIPESFLTSLFRDTSSSTRRNVMDGMGHVPGIESEQFLQIFGLLDGNPTTRGAAAIACGRLGHLEQIRDLLGLLRDQDGEVRWRAAWALWRLRDPRAKVAAENALRDQDPRVRMFAARALGDIGDSASVDTLTLFVDDPDWRVRSNVAAAIGRIGAPAGVLDILVQRLPSEEHELVAQTTAEVVGAAGRPSDVPKLTALIKRRSGSIFRGVVSGLSQGLPDSAYAFAHVLYRDVRLDVAQAAYEALGRMGTEPARALLSVTYPDLDPTRKGFVLSALREYGYLNVEPFIDEALASDNIVLAQTAVDLLSRHRDTSSTRRLETFWKRHTADTIADFKIAALQSAAALIDSMAVMGRVMEPWLREALDDEDRLVRQAAITALEKLGVNERARLGEYQTDITADTYKKIFRAFKKNPTATITTDRGDIVIELRYDKSPRTVHNFVQLAESNFYDDIIFHRVVPNFVIQAGDPGGTGHGGPGYTIRSQYNDLEYTTGAVGMASSGKDTEGSQFFITHSPQPHLDDRYTLFGYVTAGQEVVDAIRQGDRIKSINIEQ